MDKEMDGSGNADGESCTADNDNHTGEEEGEWQSDHGDSSNESNEMCVEDGSDGDDGDGEDVDVYGDDIDSNGDGTDGDGDGDGDGNDSESDGDGEDGDGDSGQKERGRGEVWNRSHGHTQAIQNAKTLIATIKTSENIVPRNWVDDDGIITVSLTDQDEDELGYIQGLVNALNVVEEPVLDGVS